MLAHHHAKRPFDIVIRARPDVLVFSPIVVSLDPQKDLRVEVSRTQKDYTSRFMWESHAESYPVNSSSMVVTGA
jgi:hypothetical protein